MSNICRLDNIEILAFTGTIVIPLFGILLNLPVIIISLKKKVVRGEFKYFLLNLACVDMMFCLSSSLLGPIPIYYKDYDSLLCKFAGFLNTTTIIAMVIATCPLAVNRYIKLYYSHELYSKLFTKRNMFLTCFSMTTFCAVYMAIYGTVFSKFTRNGSSEPCAATGPKNSLGVAYILILVLVLCAGYGACIFSNVKLHQKIKEQQTAIVNLQQEQRLKANCDLMRVAICQAAMPFICQFPLIISLAFKFSLGLYNPWLHAFAKLVLNFNPSLDAMATLYMVKPYRKAIVVFWENLKHGSFSAVGPAIQVNGTRAYMNPSHQIATMRFRTRLWGVQSRPGTHLRIPGYCDNNYF